MSAELIDGDAVAAAVRDEVRAAVEGLADEGVTPTLATVLMGTDPASETYVSLKQDDCESVGIETRDVRIDGDAPAEELYETVADLNDDPSVHGVLVQQPLPDHVDDDGVVRAVDPRKDVDGFHPWNLGRLAQRRPMLRSCTPKGIMTLLAHTEAPIRGLDATIVGASNHVGRPMGLELLLAGCTVTTAHKFSRGAEEHVRRADIVVAAAGRPGLVRGAWIREGAIVIDVGINRLGDGRIVGDVEFEAARQRASWITPVPGGVGLLTVASLLENTLQAAELAD